MEKELYRFVHLSDIHFGQERNGSIHVHDDVRDQLVRDCRDVRSQLGRADGILVTGDIAFSGQPEEYKKAGIWIEELAAIVGCDMTAVRTIPGNHDVDRKLVDGFCRLAHESLRGRAPNEVDAALEELTKGDEAANALNPKLKAYREFASRFRCDFPSVQRPAWRKEYRFPNGHQLIFIGMNSVQVCDGNDGLGNMVLGNGQYILKDTDNVEYVVLVHHPLPWFHDRAAASRYFKRARVLMFGHEHSLELRKSSDQVNGEQIEIFAGATNPDESGAAYPYRYNWLEFGVEGSSGRYSLNVSVHPRVWEYANSRFVPDMNRLNGRQSLTIGVACPKFLPPPPAVPQTMQIPSTLTAAVEREPDMGDQETKDFDKLQYYFWAYLDWHERLKALVEIDVLPSTPTQPMPQTFEKLALATAKKGGKLGELWEVVMRSVPAEKQVANPYAVGGSR